MSEVLNSGLDAFSMYTVVLPVCIYYQVTFSDPQKCGYSTGTRTVSPMSTDFQKEDAPETLLPNPSCL